jgi:hypothetical protein
MITLVPTVALNPRFAEAFESNFKALDPNDFAWIASFRDVPHCGVWLKDGSDIPCLYAAGDELGNVTVMRADNGMVTQYLAHELV